MRSQVLVHTIETQYDSFQVVDIGFFNQRKTTQDNYDTDAMAKEFLMQFTKQCFTVGQPIVFQFKSMPLTQVVVKDIEVTDLNALQQGREAKPLKVNLLLQNSSGF